jgi:hypothetical protein
LKYSELIKNHLAEYKTNPLKIPENGAWRKNNKLYPHILPEILREKNIIHSDYYEMIIDDIAKNNTKLHSDFHHLNSSQALCFNLFYPLLLKNELFSVLSKCREEIKQNEIINEYVFEYIDDDKEETNFDLFVKTKNDIRYYFEIKYTENEFGKTKNDEKHIQKYNDIYKERLKIFDIEVTMETFFNNYQIFRNLIYNKNGYNIFVFSSSRSDLESKVNKIKTDYCNEDQKNRIIILYIEDIVETILKCGNQNLIKHYELFKEKYLPSS